MLLLISTMALSAAEPWREAVSAMPLAHPARLINATNFAATFLDSFQSNSVIKAIVLMPGATDEFYFFKRAQVHLPESAKTVADALDALTQQTGVQVTFLSPFLLLHTVEDPAEPLAEVTYPEGAAKLKVRPFLPAFSWNDRDWNFVMPVMRFQMKALFYPEVGSSDMYHFYRHTLAGFGLTEWEALEAVSLAGKTTFSVERGGLFYKTRIVFHGDVRGVHKAPPVAGPVPVVKQSQFKVSSANDRFSEATFPVMWLKRDSLHCVVQCF